MAYTPQTTGVINQNPTQYNISPTAYDPAYGGIPNLPAYTTDTTQQAGTDVQSQMMANLPGYQKAVGTSMGNIQANLQGQVAPDVAANLGVQAAERGAGAGLGLSPASVTGFLARYGLTSNALQTQGQQQLLSQMQATPIQQTSTGQQTQDLAAQRAVYASAPSPAAAAAANLKAQGSGLGAGLGAAKAPGTPALPAYNAPTAGNGIQDDTWYGGTGVADPSDPNTAMANWQKQFGNLGQGAPSQDPTGQASTSNDPTSLDYWMAQLGYNPDGSEMVQGNQPTSQGQMYMGANPGQSQDQGFEDWSSMFE